MSDAFRHRVNCSNLIRFANSSKHLDTSYSEDTVTVWSATIPKSSSKRNRRECSFLGCCKHLKNKADIPDRNCSYFSIQIAEKQHSRVTLCVVSLQDILEFMSCFRQPVQLQRTSVIMPANSHSNHVHAIEGATTNRTVIEMSCAGVHTINGLTDYLVKENKQRKKEFISTVDTDDVTISQQDLTRMYDMFYKENVLSDVNLLMSIDASSQTMSGPPKTRYVPKCSPEWETYEFFNGGGGRLAKRNSDVCLYVPQGAVEGEACIHTAVCGDRAAIRSKFSIPNGVHIISPAVEYHMGGAQRFQEYVTIEMPIAEDFKNGTVYMFPHEGISDQLIEVPIYEEMNHTQHDVFYKHTEDGFIRIFAKHFCGFFICQVCNEKVPHAFRADVYVNFIDMGVRGLELELQVIFPLAKRTVRDFSEERLMCRGKFLKSEVIELDLDRKMDSDKKLDLFDHSCVEVEIARDNDEEWECKQWKGGPYNEQKQKTSLKSIFSKCCMDFYPPACSWRFKLMDGMERPDFSQFQMTLIPRAEKKYKKYMQSNERNVLIDIRFGRIGGISTDDLDTSISRNLPKEIAMFLCSNDGLLPRDYSAFARCLNLDDTKVEQICYDYQNNIKEQGYHLVMAAYRKMGHIEQFVSEVFNQLEGLNLIQTLQKLHSSLSQLEPNEFMGLSTAKIHDYGFQHGHTANFSKKNNNDHHDTTNTTTKTSCSSNNNNKNDTTTLPTNVNNSNNKSSKNSNKNNNTTNNNDINNENGRQQEDEKCTTSNGCSIICQTSVVEQAQDCLLAVEPISSCDEYSNLMETAV